MCEYVCAIVHICTSVCGSHRPSQVLLLRDHPPCLLSLSLSLASCSPSWPGWLASKLLGICLSLPSQERDCKRIPSFLAFLYGFWGSNISAHACKVSSFWKKLSPQPSKTYLYENHEELAEK